MDSRAHVEAVCTIGCLLTPNIHKVTTVRSRRSVFSKQDFGIYITKSMIPFKEGGLTAAILAIFFPCWGLLHEYWELDKKLGI